MADPILPTDASPLVRIRRGEQTRSVWSVHLPGWLEKGWRPVAGAMEPSTPVAVEPATPVPVAPAEEEPRPRRGRRKAAVVQKSEEPTEQEPEPAERESKAVAVAEQPNGAESHAQPEPDSALAAVAGLPEDLFDDPLA